MWQIEFLWYGFTLLVNECRRSSNRTEIKKLKNIKNEFTAKQVFEESALEKD